MTDQEFTGFMETHLAGLFYPPFGGKKFFNRELFDYILTIAGKDIGVLDKEMEYLNQRWSGPDQWVKLRADNRARAIKVKIYTPTSCSKVTVTADGAITREMESSE